ncbi:methionine biosynthesis protein MetW [candidate division FCPU426 bacterium]|nr:methionine biosynthesis protein MetW [candidate division FCPU426 bacterium]
MVVSLVETGSRVLDLGCGDGALLSRLIAEKQVKGMGVEIQQDAVIACIHKGLSVFQGDIDAGLADYGNASYDYVILNQTLQAIHHPDFVIEEMLRVGRRAIVSFPNFGYWLVRAQLLVKGRMPQTVKLPFFWYNTPNIHLLTIRDFEGFCSKRSITILKQVSLCGGRQGRLKTIRLFPNLLADEGLFVITRSP